MDAVLDKKKKEKEKTNKIKEAIILELHQVMNGFPSHDCRPGNGQQSNYSD